MVGKIKYKIYSIPPKLKQKWSKLNDTIGQEILLQTRGLCEEQDDKTMSHSSQKNVKIL